jgi:hypothetical protein
MTTQNSFWLKKELWLSNMLTSKEYREFQQLWVLKLCQPLTTLKDQNKLWAPVLPSNRSSLEKTRSSDSQDAREMKPVPLYLEDPVSISLMRLRDLSMMLSVCLSKLSRTSKLSMEEVTLNS